MGSSVDAGRQAVAQRQWAQAYTRLGDADRSGSLDADSLEKLATAAYLTGRDEAWPDAWSRAHTLWLERGEQARAARCAFWLGLLYLLRGDGAHSAGWQARGRRALSEAVDEGQTADQVLVVEQAYLSLPDAVLALVRGDGTAALDSFSRAREIGARSGEADLTAICLLGSGQALIMLGRTADGVVLLDEVMVGLTAGEVSTAVVGIVYCAVIETCQTIFDLRRAREWTTALHDWCSAQPDLVAYRGQCLIHRSEIMQLDGAWPDALDQARTACATYLVPYNAPAAGAAHYQVGELHRLRGELAAAESAYRDADRWGHDPQPGLALLRLAQGRAADAAAAIRHAVDAQQPAILRTRMLSAVVEIMLAAGDVTAARTAANQLSDLAAELRAPLLQAMAAQGQGAVLLAESQARPALDQLRRARQSWHDLSAPYQSAKTRVLLAQAYRELGDGDTARLEVDTAREVFERLGAVNDLAALGATRTSAPGSLTARELQVLRLVAAGRTNRSIAATLVLSEKTVARHVSNILAKLQLPSRAAATAYAYQHGLV